MQTGYHIKKLLGFVMEIQYYIVMSNILCSVVGDIIIITYDFRKILKK